MNIKMKKTIRVEMDAISENEGFARTVIAAFLVKLDPTLEELNDVKTAVSEAVTNAIIHGYQEKGGKIIIEATLDQQRLIVEIKDMGVGIEDIQKAMQPLYTTKPEGERSGLGFAFMEAFMDEVKVESIPGQGTTVHMEKDIGVQAKVGQILWTV